MKKRLLLLVACSCILGIAGRLAGLTAEQAVIVTVFSVSILGSLAFWEQRLALAFICSGALFLTRSVDLENFIKFASLDVILFLIGIMIVVGMMKESGLFQWLVTSLLRARNLSGARLFIIIMLFSAVLSALIGEVSSIIVMMAVILGITDSLKINPLPLVISSVLTTNIGSASTLLGNPIGILIALRAGLTFEDFLTHALPISAAVLLITIMFLRLWYKNYIKELSSSLSGMEKDKGIPSFTSWDAKKRSSVIIFSLMIVLIALHKRLEMFFGIEENNLLIILPVIFAGIVMVFHHKQARHYVEKEVEWYSLLFFMFLFVQAGVIQSSGVAAFLAEKMVRHIGTHPKILSVAILFSSGALSGVLDNTVVVATYVPTVKSLHALHFSLKPLWWCLLFGACFGGNLTAIGSTANIVALGLLEKERAVRADFLQWLRVGSLVTLLSILLASLAMIFVSFLSK